MRKAEEVMDDFMRTLNNMFKYQDVDLYNSNYDEIERAFSEEKKIVETDTENKEIITIKQIEQKDEEER